MKGFYQKINIVFFMLLSSCYAPMYIPNGINVPLIKEKGDANLRFGHSFSGYDFQSSYAISDQTGLMLNATYCPVGYADSYRKHEFIEAAIGRSIKTGKYEMVEIYSGLGIGKATAAESGTFDSEVTVANGRYIRLFMQVGAGGRSDILDLGAYVRCCYYNFYYMDNPETAFAKQNLRLEPIFFLGFGPPVLRIETQFGPSFNFFHGDYDYKPFILSEYDWVVYSSISVRFNLKPH